MSRFGWPPNIDPLEPLTSQRPPFKPANEQQEAVLATADWLIARCDEEIDRLRSAEVGRRRVMNHQHIFRLLSTADTTARCECGEVREASPGESGGATSGGNSDDDVRDSHGER